MRILSTCLICLLVQGCASSQLTNSRLPAGRTIEVKNIINNQDAKTYYNRFIYQTVNFPNSKHSWNRNLSIDSPYILIDRDLFAMGNLFLKEDGTYTLQYSEGRRSGSNSFDLISNKTISGSWKIDGIQLQLIGLGVASGIQIGKVDSDDKTILVDGISLTYSQDILTPGLGGKTSTLIPVLSSSGL